MEVVAEVVAEVAAAAVEAAGQHVSCGVMNSACLRAVRVGVRLLWALSRYLSSLAGSIWVQMMLTTSLSHLSVLRLTRH